MLALSAHLFRMFVIQMYVLILKTATLLTYWETAKLRPGLNNLCLDTHIGAQTH